MYPQFPNPFPTPWDPFPHPRPYPQPDFPPLPYPQPDLPACRPVPVSDCLDAGEGNVGGSESDEVRRECEGDGRSDK